jgi:hypothetical protein
MIIVYDLLTDSKINLIHHQHEVYALAFATPNNLINGGDYLVSVDYNKNDADDGSRNESGTMCLWNWAKGECMQEYNIPKSSNFNIMSGNSGVSNRTIKICFEKSGNLFFLLESAPIEFGGGYCVSVWNLGRH